MQVFGSDLSTVIAFKSEAALDVSVTSIPLENVVAIEGGDAECRARLRSIQMRMSDRNASMTISRQDVMVAIDRVIADGRCPVHWQGVSLLRLTSLAVPMDMPGLTEQASRLLKAALSKQYQDIVVVPTEALNASRSVNPGTRFDVLPPLTDRISRRMVVDVAVSEPGRATWRLPIWFSVSAMRPAMQAPRDLAIHQDLGAFSMQAAEVDWAALDGLAVSADFDLKGYSTNHAIREGDILRKGDIVRRPDVVAGDAVAVHYSSGAIRVETAAVAMQSGFVGDRILVRNERSLSEVVGEIDKPGDVEIAP